MANNRAYLCCETCVQSDETTYEDCFFFLIKYYPTTGWYPRGSDDLSASLEAWLDQHKHGDMYGEWIRLVFEKDIDDRAQSKRKILDAISESVT